MSTNPIHQHGDNWYFYDEAWADCHGPFQSEEEAIAECKRYAEEYLK